MPNIKAGAFARAAAAIMLGALATLPFGAFAAPAKIGPGSLKHAKSFSLERRADCVIARVPNPWRGAASGFVYVFHGRGTKRPSIAERGAIFIETPVRKAVAFSSSYVAALEALDVLDSLVGVDNADYVFSANARARIAAGRTSETSRNGTPNIEILTRLGPDAVFSYGTGNEWDSHPGLERAGLPVIICAEWMEDSPLGRAEWLKFFALFYGKSDEADAAFDIIERDYETARKAALAGRTGRKRPAVLANAPFQGSWNLPGGKSYVAALIRDAGGDYLWADDQGSGGLQLSAEAAYLRAFRADIWINPGTASSLAELAAVDSRFKDIPALAKGAVFSNARKSLPSGANDYFEGAVFSPQLVLKDLAAIFASTVSGSTGSAPVKEPASLEYYRLLE